MLSLKRWEGQWRHCQHCQVGTTSTANRTLAFIVSPGASQRSPLPAPGWLTASVLWLTGSAQKEMVKVTRTLRPLLNYKGV